MRAISRLIAAESIARDCQRQAETSNSYKITQGIVVGDKNKLGNLDSKFRFKKKSLDSFARSVHLH